MATYPSSIWSGNTRGTNLADAETHTTWHDDAMDEIVAAQTELGTAPSGSFATVKARLDEFDTAVTTWSSPFASGVTVGNGVTTAYYTQVGKVVSCALVFALGGTSAVTGEISLTLPVTAAHPNVVTGVGRIVDLSASASAPIAINPSSATVCLLRVHLASGTYTTFTGMSATIPWTWAVNDSISVATTYLAA